MENQKIVKDLTEKQYGLLKYFCNFHEKDFGQSNQPIDGKEVKVETRMKDLNNYPGIHIVLKKFIFNDDSPSTYTVELSSSDEENLKSSSTALFKRIGMEEEEASF